jgi:inhibitor of cysteine peptidase
VKRWSTTVLLLALLVTVAAVLTACGSDPAPDPLALGKDASGGSAELKVDQLLDVKLDGNPTTGYSWEVKTSGEPVVRLQGEPVYAQTSTGSTIVGSGGTFTFTFVGAKPGTSTIELVYRRPWETDTPPLETFVLEVTVK